MPNILGLDGRPLSPSPSGPQLIELHVGVGGTVHFSETTEVDLHIGTIARFAPGTYLIINEEDFNRMTVQPDD